VSWRVYLSIFLSGFRRLDEGFGFFESTFGVLTLKIPRGDFFHRPVVAALSRQDDLATVADVGHRIPGPGIAVVLGLRYEWAGEHQDVLQGLFALGEPFYLSGIESPIFATDGKTDHFGLAVVFERHGRAERQLERVVHCSDLFDGRR
jgi:hypothetical protein